MKSVLPFEKGFRQQSDTLAKTTRILIARIKNHIEQDNCNHCRAVLKQEDGLEAPTQKAPSPELQLIDNSTFPNQWKNEI